MDIDKVISVARSNRAALLKQKPSASPASGIGDERRITSCGCRGGFSTTLHWPACDTNLEVGTELPHGG
jgi:hypothetical protein